MSKARINRQVLESVRQATRKDPLIQEFLLGLLAIESEYSGHWRWKKFYQDKLQELTNRRKQSDEDQQA